MTHANVEDEAAWEHWAGHWNIRSGTTYLNHGSFGVSPQPVCAQRQRWLEEIEANPADFYFRRLESAWQEARRSLARFVGTRDENLVFVENATVAMNVLAESFPLSQRDEVLLTDHAYGAVLRVWQRACQRAGAAPPVVTRLPLPIESPIQVVEALFRELNDRTRLIVVSHVTSPTAVILPVEAICRRAREEGVAVCIDGPHALVQTPLDIDALGCDFYTASCHKWLSAPFGSGFFYAAPRHHDSIQPPVLSWGRLEPDKPDTWDQEFIWCGTRDPSAYLAVPSAIEFIESVGLEAFRARTHYLARYARERLLALTGLAPITPDSPGWYGSMVTVPLPPGDSEVLKEALWQRFGIEAPIVAWNERRWIRVSCHLYNSRQDVDRLVEVLATLLNERS